MPKRRADATWEGTLQDGKGTMRMASGSYEGPYSFVSRFEEGAGTNPEELIAAAHAGCFSMAFAGGLGRAGHNPTRISTTAEVSIERQEGGFRITKIHLTTEGVVPGIGEDEFREQAEAAKKGCPVSVALGGVPEITVDASLAG